MEHLLRNRQEVGLRLMAKGFGSLGFKASTQEKPPSGPSYLDFLDCKKNATLFESFAFR
jgi:hypothetical protein